MQNQAANSSSTTESEPFRIELADDEFSNDRLCRLSHNADSHPLMQLDQLRNLAHFLMPLKQCRFVDPAIKIDSAFSHQSESGDRKDIDEVFDRIEEPGSWIALYNVEAHPEYDRFLKQLIDCVRPLVEPEQGNIFNVGGFIFISAPPSVTPFHIDRENNFWLQLNGRKQITVFDCHDREVVPASVIENFILTRDLEQVRLTDSIADRGTEILSEPGQGVYFPSTSPHMTRCPEEWKGGDISISMGVVFYTDHTRKMARIHQCNDLLRRLGMTPAFPGAGGWRDSIKAPIGRTVALLKRRLRGYRPPPGSY